MSRDLARFLRPSWHPATTVKDPGQQGRQGSFITKVVKLPAEERWRDVEAQPDDPMFTQMHPISDPGAACGSLARGSAMKSRSSGSGLGRSRRLSVRFWFKKVLRSARKTRL